VDALHLAAHLAATGQLPALRAALAPMAPQEEPAEEVSMLAEG
jgi:hypothetical protein